MNVDNKKIDYLYDLIDKACMIYYKDQKENPLRTKKVDYLESFIEVSKAIVNGFDIENTDLSNKNIKKYNEIIEKITSEEFLNEEVRLAVELILIKGFKHRNLSLDFFTPDTINYVFSYIINSIITNNKKYSESEKITVMDTVLGTSNLLQTIINNAIIEVKGIGIDNDELLIYLSETLANLLDNELVINYGNAEEDSHGLADVIIGDFGEISPYKMMIKRLDNLDDKGYFVYLINNDFFSKAPSDFKEKMTKESTLCGLIVLPKSFVSENHQGKSILIGKKERLNDYHMAVVQFSDSLTQDNIQNTFNKINKMIKVIGG